MQRETQPKAIAGAIAALVAAMIPLIMSFVSGVEYSPASFQTFADAAMVLGTVVVGSLVGWAGVYFAPRNVPIEDKEK